LGLQFIVALRSSSANCKILTLVHHCRFWIYWPPLSSKTREIRSLPYPENESQYSTNNIWSCILGQSQWQMVANIQKRGIGHLDRESQKRQASNAILKMSVNRASTLFVIAGQVIEQRLGYCNS
jgi:hypothetical protein